MGDEYDNVVGEDNFGKGWDECSGDGQIHHYQAVTGIYDFGEACIEDPRDCSRCPLYKEYYERKS